MSWKDVVLDLGLDLSDEAVAYLVAELERFEAQADSAWKHVILSIVKDLLRKHGVKGVKMAVELIRDVAQDKAPDLSDLSLRNASDVVAKLQKAEADRKSSFSEYMGILAEFLTELFKGFVAIV